jgi:hypothetical protein
MHTLTCCESAQEVTRPGKPWGLAMVPGRPHPYKPRRPSGALFQQPVGAAHQGGPPQHPGGRIFPGRATLIRPVGPILAKQHDARAVTRRFMSAESLAEACLRVIPGDHAPDAEEVMAIEQAA